MRNLILVTIVSVFSVGTLFYDLDVHAQSDSESGIITKEQIKETLGDTRTRGIGGVTSLTFGESLIPFDYNKSNIRSDALPQLNELGGALNEMVVYKDIAVVRVDKVSKTQKPVIEVRGYTDSRGSYDYNMRLSKKRAQAVVDYLCANYDIPRYKLVAKGYGENNLLCTDSNDEACHAINRRVEVTTLPGAEFSSTTRGIDDTSSKGLNYSLPVIDYAALYKKPGSDKLHEIRNGNTILISNSDKITIFFRPRLDSYVEVRQKDGAGNFQTLFPRSFVRKGKDYWLPAFGEAYTLDSNRGQETIIVYSSLNDPGTMTVNQFQTAITRSLDNPTRSIRAVPPEVGVEVESDTLYENAAVYSPNVVTVVGVPGDIEWNEQIIFQHR